MGGASSSSNPVESKADFDKKSEAGRPADGKQARSQAVKGKDNLRGVSIASLNMNGGLEKGHVFCNDSKAADINDWVERHKGIILLQHTGVLGNEVPHDVKKVFPNKVIRVCGDEEQPQASVAVIADEAWKVLSKVDDTTGRLLGVELSSGSVTLRVVSIYMPAGLEGVSISASHPTRALANRLAEKAANWARQAQFFFIGGDWNEVARRKDRQVGGNRKKRRPVNLEHMKMNTINGILLNPNHNLVDVHRYANGDKKVEFTRVDKRTGGSARLDMLLASRQLVAETENWECYTELGNSSDHDMLVASFDFVAHKGSETGLSTRDKAWARAGDKVRSVTKMSRSMAARFKSIVLAKCKDALEGLAQTLGWDKARAALAGGSAGEIGNVRN